jgi:sec-independent protein translocase protein TatA
MVCSSMNVMLGIFNLGGGEIILILALVLILFGAKKLPELAKGLGTGIKEFKKATREVTDEVSRSVDEAQSQPRLPASSAPTPQPQVEATSVPAVSPTAPAPKA